MTDHDRDAGNPWIRTLAAIAAIVALFVLGSLVSRMLYPDRQPVIRSLAGETMGTTWTVKMSVPEEAVAAVEAALDTVEARLERVNRAMSTWDSESEISRFNRHASLDPFPVSPGFVDVVRRAQVVSRATDGAFDVTVAPLVTAWGFGPGGTPGRPATPSAVSTASSHVGYELLQIADDGRALRKLDPELSIDLSAIAKGYAVDRIAEGLTSLGLLSFAVEVGGEVSARGLKPDGTPWSVGIEAPDPAARTILRSLPLQNTSIATSGDYRNWYEADGRRYAHIVDPGTGAPVAWRGFSVTVVHESATFADAWATGLSVLGPEAGLDVADREGLAALFVLSDPAGGYEERPSAAWERSGFGEATATARAATPTTIPTTASGIS